MFLSTQSIWSTQLCATSDSLFSFPTPFFDPDVYLPPHHYPSPINSAYPYLRLLLPPSFLAASPAVELHPDPRMDIPVINRIGGLDAAVSSSPDANFICRVFASLSTATAEGIFKSHHLLKWSALIIALLAAFSSVGRRIKMYILSFPSLTHGLSQPLLHHIPQFDDGFSDDDTESLSSCSSNEDDDDVEPASTFGNSVTTDRDFTVRGSARISSDSENSLSMKLRRRFSWSDLAPGKRVVKIWENLRLDFDVDVSSGKDQISIYDINKEQKINSFLDPQSPISSFWALPRSMIVSAAQQTSGNLTVKLWDNRVECQIPAIIAEWKPKVGKIVSVWSGGLHQLYVGEDETGDVTVADARKVRSGLERLRAEEELDESWSASSSERNTDSDSHFPNK